MKCSTLDVACAAAKVSWITYHFTNLVHNKHNAEVITLTVSPKHEIGQAKIRNKKNFVLHNTKHNVTLSLKEPLMEDTNLSILLMVKSTEEALPFYVEKKIFIYI